LQRGCKRPGWRRTSRTRSEKFTDTADEKSCGKRSYGIDELNAAAKNFSSSKAFSRDYLALLGHAKGTWLIATGPMPTRPSGGDVLRQPGHRDEGRDATTEMARASSVIWLLFLIAVALG